MDPLTIATLASTAVSLLIPYLQKAGEAVAESVGATAVDKVKELYGSIKAKFSSKPAANEALDDLTNNPSDADTQAAMRTQLKKALETDPDFAAKLTALLNEADKAGVDSVFKTNIHGNVGKINQIQNIDNRGGKIEM